MYLKNNEQKVSVTSIMSWPNSAFYLYVDNSPTVSCSPCSLAPPASSTPMPPLSLICPPSPSCPTCFSLWFVPAQCHFTDKQPTVAGGCHWHSLWNFHASQPEQKGKLSLLALCINSVWVLLFTENITIGE